MVINTIFSKQVLLVSCKELFTTALTELTFYIPPNT